MKKELELIKQRILDAKSIFIASHENPDADAIGSILSLGHGLRQLDKDVTMYSHDGVPETLRFLPLSDHIIPGLNGLGEGTDLIILVDCSETERVGSEFASRIGTGAEGKMAVIDHHKTNSIEIDTMLLDRGASSTGMIVFRLLNYLGVKIDSDIATNLYATIVGDTGSFKYSNTTSDTFEVAAKLVEHGADPEFVSQSLYENEPPRKIELLGLVIPTLELNEDGRIASVVVDKSMYESTGTDRHDTEGIVNIPRSINGVEVAVLFRQENGDGEDTWKISMRSKGDVDVANIAETFGGGGHRKAAGCSLTGDLKDVRHRLCSSITEVLP